MRKSIRWVGVLGILIFLAAPVKAQEVTVQEGYASKENAMNAGGGFDYLPNGDVIAITYENDGGAPSIYIFDANGDGVPAAPETVGTLPVGSYGSFIKASPDGTFALLGVTGSGSSHDLIKVNLSDYSMATLTQVSGNFDLLFLDNERVLVSANSSFSPEVPNQILFLNLNKPDDKKAVIEIQDTPSGGIVRNSVRDIYYLKGTRGDPFPGSHKLLKFKASQIKSAIENGTILQEADSQINIALDGGYDVAVNPFNDLFVSSLDGKITKINEKDGTTEEFCTAANGHFSYLSFYRRGNFFNPFEPSPAKLAASMADATYANSYLLELTPAQSDSFADEVLSFNPGTGGGGDPQIILGAPQGGGTYNPNNNPDVSIRLGDRDNPDTSSPAAIEVKFDRSIKDEAQNLDGLDFIVFSNSFFSGGNERNRFAEPALIEVSQDLNHNGLADDEWYLIAPNILPDDLGPLNPVEYPSMTLRNYGDYTPTLLLGDTDSDNVIDVPDMDPEDFYTVPDRLSYEGDVESYLVDHFSGGGDAVDLREAVVQSAPGVPLVDAFGQRHYVYLDAVNFIRVRDARNGDFHAVVGPVTAEVDAIADAKSHLRGNAVTVKTVSELEAALLQVQNGDEIVLEPGLYLLNSTINLPEGVNLKGNAGLWTVYGQWDDSILRGDNLPANAPAVKLVDTDGYISEQGYAISGLHFENCSVGVSVNGLSPTIENNFFTNVTKAVVIEDEPDETVVIRHNVFGHRESRSAGLGVLASNAQLAILHNTFVGHQKAAVMLRDNAQAYLRDNIFWKNRLGVGAKDGGYLYGHHNVFNRNATNYNLSSQAIMENDVLVDPLFALATQGDYRLNVDSAARGRAMGGSDPGVYDGADFLPFNIPSANYKSKAGDSLTHGQ